MIRILSLAAIGALLLVAAPVGMADADSSKSHKSHKQAKVEGSAKAPAEVEVEAVVAGELEAVEQPGPASGEEMVGDHAGHRDNGKGAAKSAEMKAQNEEREAVKAEYKEAVDGGAERVKGKKPWWKFGGE